MTDKDLRMRVITKEVLITTAAERFREAHQRRGEWMASADGSDAPGIYARLRALPSDAGEEAVTAVVGDKRYTENICDECGEDKAVTILLGEEIHHPTDMAAICYDCLKQARRLADASR
jgi:hypothetical protein